MILTIEKPKVSVRGADSFSCKSSIEYEIGARVIYKENINNPGVQAPGEKLLGTVISRFRNPIDFTYRIELDVVWSNRVSSSVGKKVIAGNVTAWSLSQPE